MINGNLGTGTATVSGAATTTLNGTPVRVRDCTRLEDATLLTSDTLNPAKYQDGPAFDALAKRVRLLRTWADCYGYLLLASGRADIALDPIMNPWDIAALVPIVRGAGGIITDWEGGAAYPAESTIATTPGLHAQVIGALRV